MNEKWFLNDISQIEKKLKTNAASGLSRKAARSAFRAKSHVYGKLFLHPRKSIFIMLKELLSDFALILLLLCAVLALLFDELHLGATTLVLCLASIFISFIFYYRSQRSMEQVDMYFMPTAKVIRGGKLYKISFDNVVPGDVILLEKGDVVCGDARLVLSDNLSVAMRVSETEYVPLKKQSNAMVSDSENNPRNFTNILHAGSIINEGSARAIVYATGKYTYLGAKTGGIYEKHSDNVPKELKRLRSICSKISMISMLCVLPFCIISLLFSNVRGGTVTLSASFLTALAVCTSAMTQLCYTLCRSFFVHKIKSLANAKTPVALRSTDALDKIRNLTHLFMLDGCALTDGVLHFDSAFTGEGEAIDIRRPNKVSQYLIELAAIYNIADTESLSMGISEPEKFKQGLDELINEANVDINALKIRCPIKSYIQKATADSVSKVFFSDMGREGVLSVTTNIDIISQCKTVLTTDGPRPFSAFAMDRIKHTLGYNDMRGKQVLLFTVSAQQNQLRDSDKCFVGAIALSEGIDPTASKAIAALKANGVKVISFADSKDNLGPDIPESAYGSVRVSKAELIKKKLPLTYKFGEIDTYFGFDSDDIATLVKHSQTCGGSVAVLSFSDYAINAINASDVFITCAPIINVFSAKSEKELFELESMGRGSSEACEQSLKRQADVLFPRPSRAAGGIKALNTVFVATNRALHNLSDFLRYLLVVQIVRIVCVAFPMLFGSSILDARHILLYSLICDIPMLLILSLRSVPRHKTQKINLGTLNKEISFNKIMLISAIALSLFTIFLPEIISFIGIFGPHLYAVEYMFCAVLWIHIASMILVFTQDKKDPRVLIKDKLCVQYLAFVLILMILIAVISPLGLFIDWISLPVAYFIATLIPAAALLFVNYRLKIKK